MMWIGEDRDARNILVVVASKCPRSRELLPHRATLGTVEPMFFLALAGTGVVACLAKWQGFAGQLYLPCFNTMQKGGCCCH